MESNIKVIPSKIVRKLVLATEKIKAPNIEKIMVMGIILKNNFLSKNLRPLKAIYSEERLPI